MASVEELVQEQNAIELAIFVRSLELLKPLYEKRRLAVKQLPKFWPAVIEASELLSEFITYEDTELIDALEDVYVEWDTTNVKNFDITLTFGDNGYFGPKALKKSFVFNSEKETYSSSPVPIDWQPGKDLTQHQPGRDTSFFNWFAYDGSIDTDTEGSEIAQIITEELYPHALKFYQASQQDDDIVEEYDISEDEDEDDGDDVDDDNENA